MKSVAAKKVKSERQNCSEDESRQIFVERVGACPPAPGFDLVNRASVVHPVIDLNKQVFPSGAVLRYLGTKPSEETSDIFHGELLPGKY